MDELANLKAADIKSVDAEAGVIASIIVNPEYVFYSEGLKPNYFTDPNNAYIYYAVCELAKRGIEQIDAYNITNIMNLKKLSKEITQNITIEALNEFIQNASLIARKTPEEYTSCVRTVMEAAFRRNTYQQLVQCERLCFSSSEQQIQQRIYQSLDDVMMEFTSTRDVPQYKDVVDRYWQQIEAKQGRNGITGIPFKFPVLNNYATLEAGELFIFGAEAKQGKSMMLLNCAVEAMRHDKRVLYIDSELNSVLFTNRLISYLTGIRFSDVKNGRYGEEGESKIEEAKEWIKTRGFTHVYMPIFDEQTIYTTIKKVYHTQGIDLLVIDYFKSGGDGDAFATYQAMGSLVDMIKNRVCGDMGIAGVGAAQATSTMKLADSAKIIRNASTIAFIQDKTQQEIEEDGDICGNKKLIVKYNRNGPQMCDGEYIDLDFDGNIISFTEAQQHRIVSPY